MTEIGKVGGPVPPQQPKTPQQIEKKRDNAEAAVFVRSETTVNIAELIKMAKESPEVRQQLVEHIRKAIEQNVYNVDAERIAQRLLREL